MKANQVRLFTPEEINPYYALAINARFRGVLLVYASKTGADPEKMFQTLHDILEEGEVKQEPVKCENLKSK